MGRTRDLHSRRAGSSPAEAAAVHGTTGGGVDWSWYQPGLISPVTRVRLPPPQRRLAARQDRDRRQSAAHPFPRSSTRQSSAPLRRRSEGSTPSGERRTVEAGAQLVRAPGRQPGGRRFKSGQSRSRSHLKRGRPTAAAGPPGRLAQQSERPLDSRKAGGSTPPATTSVCPACTPSASAPSFRPDAQLSDPAPAPAPA
jgi:hypothetical protein